MAFIRPVLRALLRPVLRPVYCSRYGGGGVGPSDPGGAWLWLMNIKTWSAVVGSGEYTAEESAGLAMVLDL